MPLPSSIQEPGRVSTNILFWPSFVDVLITVLMIFVLQLFIQTNFNIKNLEDAFIQQSQEELDKALNDALKHDFEGTVFIERAPNIMQIRFTNNVLFDTGDYRLGNVGKNILTKCASVLRNKSNLYQEIQVEGHTDWEWKNESSKYPHNNWELSTARALSVVDYLMRFDGIDSRRLSANGYADSRPIKGKNGSPDPDLSRRIELRIIFKTTKTDR